MYDFAVVGGGILGLSTGMALGHRFPRARILILEKEHCWAFHQTGHNSGVIHSGIYYKPGSLKATFCREGNRSMVEFCRAHGIEYAVCGKVIVATEPEELPLLNNLYERGKANGLEVTRIGGAELKEIEPYARGLAALRVPSTGIVNYKRVAETFAHLIETQGGDLRLGTKVLGICENRQGIAIETDRGAFEAKFLINCAGLQSDRVAKLGQVATKMKIIPFRGEYFELKPEKRYLVKSPISPVPNPNFPFLGVHFTKMIDGNVHAGPNAVLSLKREGYRKTDISVRDLFEIINYPAFWKFAGKYLGEGIKELIRSLSKTAFVRSLQKLVPDVQEEDLIPAPAGIRAQALMYDGKLVDDFLILHGQNALHVCNAPSPAATASIQIGKAVVEQIPM
ncbi:MAG: L-2-hydroxyglutarate oxidase [Nitrospiraceae bacterium]